MQSDLPAEACARVGQLLQLRIGVTPFSAKSGESLVVDQCPRRRPGEAAIDGGLTDRADPQTFITITGVMRKSLQPLSTRIADIHRHARKIGALLGENALQLMKGAECGR